MILRGKILTLSRAIDWDEDRALSMEFWRAFRQSDPGYWAGPGAALFGRHDPAQGPVLISHESLHDHNPFRGDGPPAGMEREPAVLAGRLAAIARHAWPHGTLKAWFFFRRQAEWLASIYAHSCWQLPDPSQQDFEQRTRALLATPSARILDHALLLETLGAALGPHNVLALPYEELREPATWDRIRAFTGIADLAAGVDFSDRSVNVKRRPGEEVWRVTRRATTLSGGTIALPPDLARAVGDAFAPANRRLAAMIGRDLAALGYW